ncbi:MAG: DUF983 domain-containing protein [Myxococcales bacterium]|nr:DUF983 domain-containing protein [Myxococcales bacterium]
MFAHPLKMHARCTSCGHSFDRGNGYFLGAMFMSYALVVLIEVAVIAGLLLAGLGWWTIVIVAAALVPVIGPLVAFPYSRVIWVMIERRMLHWGEEDDAALRQELTRRQRARTASSEEEAT